MPAKGSYGLAHDGPIGGRSVSLAREEPRDTPTTDITRISDYGGGRRESGRREGAPAR
jgi:hypothetical protein